MVQVFTTLGVILTVFTIPERAATVSGAEMTSTPMSYPAVTTNATVAPGPKPRVMIDDVAIEPYEDRVRDVGAVELSSVNTMDVVLPSSFLQVSVVPLIDNSPIIESNMNTACANVGTSPSAA